MTTYHIKWHTPDGEKSDWIWAKSLKDAQREADFRERGESDHSFERAMKALLNTPIQNTCPCCGQSVSALAGLGMLHQSALRPCSPLSPFYRQ